MQCLSFIKQEAEAQKDKISQSPNGLLFTQDSVD